MRKITLSLVLFFALVAVRGQDATKIAAGVSINDSIRTNGFNKITANTLNAILHLILNVNIDSAQAINTINGQKGGTNGIAGLSSGKVPLSQLPNFLVAAARINDTSLSVTLSTGTIDTIIIRGAAAGASDTVSLSNRINGKLNLSDTASMLFNYIRYSLGMKYSDTASMLAPYLLISEFTPTILGLGNVVNSLQVINAGGMNSIKVGTFASIPTPGSGPTLYYATDTNALYYNNTSAYIKISGGGTLSYADVVAALGFLPTSPTLLGDSIAAVRVALGDTSAILRSLIASGGIIFPARLAAYLNAYGAFAYMNTDSIAEGTTNKFFHPADTTGLAGKATQVALVDTAAAIRTALVDTAAALRVVIGSGGLVYPNTTNKYLNGYGNFPAFNADSIPAGTTNKYFVVGDTAGLAAKATQVALVDTAAAIRTALVDTAAALRAIQDTTTLLRMGHRGDTIARTAGGNIYTPGLVDSTHYHHVINGDSTWSFYISDIPSGLFRFSDSICNTINGVRVCVLDSTGGVSSSQTLQQTFNQEVGGSVITKNDSLVLGTFNLLISSTGGVIAPLTTNSIDFGTNSLAWKTLHASNLVSPGTASIGSALGAPINFNVNGVQKAAILSTGQHMDSSYIGNVFAGTITGGNPDSILTINNGFRRKVPASAFSGGGGTPSGSTGAIQISKLGGFSNIPSLTADTLTGTLNVHDAVVGDSIRSGINEAMDSIWFFGYSITHGFGAFLRWPTQVANAYGSYENNQSVSGTRLVQLTPLDSSLEEKMLEGELPHYNGQPDKFIFLEFTVNDAGSGSTAPTDSNRYRIVWDSVFTLLKGAPYNWPANRIVSITGTLVGYNVGSGGILSPGMANELIYSGIARRAADSAGVIDINLIPYMQANGGYALLNNDSLHPNQGGHNVMARGALPYLDSVNYVRTNSMVVEKRLTDQGPADIRGNLTILAGTTTNTLTVSSVPGTGGIFSTNPAYSLPVYTGLKINGDIILDQRKWGIYYGYSGATYYWAGIGVSPTNVSMDFAVPASSWKGFRFGTTNTGDSTYSAKDTIDASGNLFTNNISARGTGSFSGKLTASAGYKLSATSALPGDGHDTQHWWENGNTKAGGGFAQSGSPYFLDFYTPSTANYGIRLGNMSTSDGTTFTPWITFQSGIMTVPFGQLPYRASADSIVTTHTNAGIDSLGKMAISAFALSSNVVSGSYTPTFTNTTNLASSSPSTCYYSRNGNIVHVMVVGTLTPTAGTAQTVLTFSLPITSSLSGGGYGTGVFASNGFSALAGAVGQATQVSTTTATFTFYDNMSSATGEAVVIQFDYSL